MEADPGHDEEQEAPPLEESRDPRDETNITDEERGFGSHLSRSLLSNSVVPDETELRTRATSVADSVTRSASNFIKNKTSQVLEVVTPSTSQVEAPPLTPKLAALVDAYAQSDIAASIRGQIEQLSHPESVNETLPDVAVESILLRGRQRASWATQFRILSGRAFKNLYRDPALLAAHYISSIGIACRARPASLNCLLLKPFA
jgi:hypothetical protein